MKITVNAIMQETDGINEQQLESLKTFAGKNAGISQLREGYFGTDVSDDAKARKRFDATTKMGHTSIAGHAKVSVIFENTTRLFAMIMNSLQYYDTTEKSGRYTEMTGNSTEQCALYDKWKDIFKKRILTVYPDYDDAFIQKQLKMKGHINIYVKNGRVHDDHTFEDITDNAIVQDSMEEILANPRLPVNTRAQENARYILSIFTKSTTFSYTTSLDQWNFIADWCDRYTEQFSYVNVNIRDVFARQMKDGTIVEASWFEEQVCQDLTELSDFIKKNLYCETIRDHKKRGFDMLTSILDKDHPMTQYEGRMDEHIGFSYCTDYMASFIVLSHLHRHRTIKYWMILPKEEYMRFYIPPFIKDTEYEQEWLKDMNSVKHLWPQGTLVRIIEAGTLDNFVLKASERYCGCAMWETMNNVKKVGKKFAAHYESGNATELEKYYIERFYDPDKKQLRTKNEITDGCREGCYFGCERAIDRIV